MEAIFLTQEKYNDSPCMVVGVGLKSILYTLYRVSQIVFSIGFGGVSTHSVLLA